MPGVKDWLKKSSAESNNLDSYGYDSRYPNDHFYIDKQSTEEAIEMAEKVLRTIEKKIMKKFKQENIRHE